MDLNYFTFSEYMKKSGLLSANEEDYIEMIYRLCLEKGYTRVSDIANSLNIKPPSVSNMLKRLAMKKLVHHVDYGTIELSNDGLLIGKILFERHLIIEKFLTIINFKEPLLEEIELIEHTLKKDTVNQIRKLVDFFTDNPEIQKRYQDYCIEIK